MGNVRTNLKKALIDTRATLLRLQLRDFSSFDEGDRLAVKIGTGLGVGLTILSPASCFADGDNATDIGDTVNTGLENIWNLLMKILYPLGGVCILVGILWAMVSGEKKVAAPISFIKRTGICLIAAALVVTVIKWISTNFKSDSFSDL